jgi:hypothetical protein
MIILDKLAQLHLFAQASSTNLSSAGSSCDPGTGGLFGLPPWNKYLVDAGSYVWKPNTIDGVEPTFVECRLDNFGLNDIWLIVEAFADMVIYVVAIIAVVMIIWGGFRMITSQGSPDTIKDSRNTILYAVIGLVIAISAKVAIMVVNSILNTDIGTTVL